MRLCVCGSSARGSAPSASRRLVARWDRDVRTGVSLSEAATADSGDAADGEAAKDDEDGSRVGGGNSSSAANGSVNTVSAAPGSFADDPLRLSSRSSVCGLSAVRGVHGDSDEDAMAGGEARLQCCPSSSVQQGSACVVIALAATRGVGMGKEDVVS